MTDRQELAIEVRLEELWLSYSDMCIKKGLKPINEIKWKKSHIEFMGTPKRKKYHNRARKSENDLIKDLIKEVGDLR